MISDFTLFLTVFRPYQDEGSLIIKGCVQWNGRSVVDYMRKITSPVVASSVRCFSGLSDEILRRKSRLRMTCVGGLLNPSSLTGGLARLLVRSTHACN